MIALVKYFLSNYLSSLHISKANHFVKYHLYHRAVPGGLASQVVSVVGCQHQACDLCKSPLVGSNGACIYSQSRSDQGEVYFSGLQTNDIATFEDVYSIRQLFYLLGQTQVGSTTS
jgi:hypothetical protein